MTDPIHTDDNITLDIQRGLELGLKYVNQHEQNVDLALMTYNQLASMDAKSVSGIDWVLLGPDSKQISNFEYLNKIRNKRALDDLNGFVLWQLIDKLHGISAHQLSQEVDQLTEAAGHVLFSTVYRLWQAHVKLSGHQPGNRTLDLAEFTTQWCLEKACEQWIIYPNEQQLLLTGVNQSSADNISVFTDLPLKWVLVNATLEQTMQFSFVKELSILGFYHYQKSDDGKSMDINDWLIENHLTQYSWAPNQYVALGFQAILNMVEISMPDSIIEIKNNQLQWRNFTVQFQQGWPVLNEVSMDKK